MKPKVCSSMRAVIFGALLAIASGEVTFVEPQRSITCPDVGTCEITLTVSRVETLTAYEYEPTSGTRGRGHMVEVGADGELDFLLEEPDDAQLLQPVLVDGHTRRNVIVFNNQLPGPTIIGYEQQLVKIRVINDLSSDSISVHWHGQYVRGQPFMDGVPFVTQCPILPGTEFTYEFNLYPSGSYWYHSHSGYQRYDGLFGALIVKKRTQTPTDYEDLPDQHTITLFEFFQTEGSHYFGERNIQVTGYIDPVKSHHLYHGVSATDGSSISSGPMHAAVINHAGWLYSPDAATCQRMANTSLPVFTVESGKKYRFRLIGTQSDIGFRFSIQGHKMRLVATDGVDITTDHITSEIDYIIIYSGERYDFILEANQTVDNYLVVMETVADPDALNTRGFCIKSHRAYAVLQYEGANTSIPQNLDENYDPTLRCPDSTQPCFAVNCPFKNYPTSHNITCISVDEFQLTSPEEVPDTDVSSSVFLNFLHKHALVSGAFINNRNFKDPTSALLSQSSSLPEETYCEYTQDPQKANQYLKPCTHIYNVNSDTTEMVFMVFGHSRPHPIHMHGHHFRVLKTGYPPYDQNGKRMGRNTDIACEGDGSCNSAVNWFNGTRPPIPLNPLIPKKDTIIVPSGGYVVIRFSRDNWGWWLLHCHLVPHLNGGMNMVINETSASNGPLQAPTGFPKCGNFPPTQPLKDPDVTADDQVSFYKAEASKYMTALIAIAAVAGVLLLLVIVMAILLSCCCCRLNSHKEKRNNSHELKENNK